MCLLVWIVLFVCLFVIIYICYYLRGLDRFFMWLVRYGDDNKVCYRIRCVVDIVLDKLSEVYEKNYLVVI